MPHIRSKACSHWLYSALTIVWSPASKCLLIHSSVTRDNQRKAELSESPVLQGQASLFKRGSSDKMLCVCDCGLRCHQCKFIYTNIPSNHAYPCSQECRWARAMKSFRQSNREPIQAYVNTCAVRMWQPILWQWGSSHGHSYLVLSIRTLIGVPITVSVWCILPPFLQSQVYYWLESLIYKLLYGLGRGCRCP